MVSSATDWIPASGESLLSEPSGRPRAAAGGSLVGAVDPAADHVAARSSPSLFIFYFIGRDAIPFFQAEGFGEFFTSTDWYPSGDPPAFGALAIFFGSAMVTVGAILVAVPLGVLAALCLSDILPFSMRQMVKPVIEILAAIPSVAYGFFALVVFAPLLAGARRPAPGRGSAGSSARRWPCWASSS